MRPTQKNNRPRNKGGRKPAGPSLNKVYESSGPEGKVRGTPQQIIEKYQALARDKATAGDRVLSESFLQHAEHYTRILIAAQAAAAPQRREEPRPSEGARDEEFAAAEAGEMNGTPASDDGVSDGMMVIGEDEQDGASELVSDDDARGRANGQAASEEDGDGERRRPRRNTRRARDEEDGAPSRPRGRRRKSAETEETAEASGGAQASDPDGASNGVAAEDWRREDGEAAAG